MARLRLLHWNAKEAAEDLTILEAAGFQVDYDEAFRPGMLREWRTCPPAAFVISLSRLPSHGREIATEVRQSPATRAVPIVFYDGAPQKVEKIKAELPDAVYCVKSRLKAAVRSAIAHPPKTPVIPTRMMDRYASRTAAEKLGIKAGSTVALVDPPNDFAAVIGQLPPGVEFADEPAPEVAVTLCFVRDAHAVRTALSTLRHHAASTKLWALWPKKSARAPISAEITEDLIRETGIGLGLVDYKICSVNQTWSGILFAAKKARAR